MERETVGWLHNAWIIARHANLNQHVTPAFLPQSFTQ